MTKCTDPSHQLAPTQEDFDRVEADKKKALAEAGKEKRWFAVEVYNEPLLVGNLRIQAASSEEAKAIFEECLQRNCTITAVE